MGLFKARMVFAEYFGRISIISEVFAPRCPQHKLAVDQIISDGVLKQLLGVAMVLNHFNSLNKAQRLRNHDLENSGWQFLQYLFREQVFLLESLLKCSNNEN